jgi:hypothetical protein
MDRFFFAAGSSMALLAVALGAFAAHALKLRLAPDMMNIFETGVRYHMYHALGLLAVAWAAARWQPLSSEPDGRPLARRDHTDRRCRFSYRLGDPVLVRRPLTPLSLLPSTSRSLLSAL